MREWAGEEGAGPGKAIPTPLPPQKCKATAGLPLGGGSEGTGKTLRRGGSGEKEMGAGQLTWSAQGRARSRSSMRAQEEMCHVGETHLCTCLNALLKQVVIPFF